MEERVGFHKASMEDRVEVGNVTELWGAADGGVAVTSEVQQMQLGISLLVSTHFSDMNRRDYSVATNSSFRPPRQADVRSKKRGSYPRTSSLSQASGATQRRSYWHRKQGLSRDSVREFCQSAECYSSHGESPFSFPSFSYHRHVERAWVDIASFLF